MRCLLDENMARSLARALTERGHPTFHVIDLGLASSSDEDLLELAADFDLFITFDRLLQPREWHAARDAMLKGVRIVRLRETASRRANAAAQLRMLWRCWPLIEQRMGPDGDARLAIIARDGLRVRFRNADQIRAMRRPEPQ